ncbi:type I 3-dehydroquinate dehydratase [Terrisporobacter sp.]
MNKVKVGNVVLGDGIPKVCISLVGKTREEIKNQCKQVASMDVDIVEWRCDFFEEIFDESKVIELIKEIRFILKEKPLIFTIRSKVEGGEISIDDNKYIDLYKEVCKLNTIDIIDIELRIGEENIKELVSLFHENNTKIILSKHDFQKTPSLDKMLEYLLKMQNLKCDIPKLAVMPKDYLDVVKLLEVTAIMKEKYDDTPVITMSMGDKGMISRIGGQVFGSCLTFTSGIKASAPGQIGIEDLRTSMRIIDKYYEKSHKFKNSNIILIGFMGTGKSSVSSKLSQVLDIKKIDTDELIESQENMTIEKIFLNYGEDYFRKCETKALIELSNEKNMIISCGGGIILKEENIKIMKNQGKIVLLTATPEVIYDRVKNSNTRPILNKNMSIEYISNLIEDRKDKYLKAADIIIDTDNKNLEEICEEIINNI